MTTKNAAAEPCARCGAPPRYTDPIHPDYRPALGYRALCYWCQLAIVPEEWPGDADPA